MTDQSHHISKASDKKKMFRGEKKTLPNRPETLAAKAVALVNNPIIADPDKLDVQIKSMMTVTDDQSNDRHHKLAICNICGKEGPSNNMPSHIEANHITGVSHSCNICGKTSRSTDALRKHKHNYHNALLQDQTRLEEAQVYATPSSFNVIISGAEVGLGST